MPSMTSSVSTSPVHPPIIQLAGATPPLVPLNVNFDSFMHRQRTANPMLLQNVTFAAFSGQHLEFYDPSTDGVAPVAGSWRGTGIRCNPQGLYVSFPFVAGQVTVSLVDNANGRATIWLFDSQHTYFETVDLSGLITNQAETVLISRPQGIGLIGVGASVETYLCRVQAVQLF